MHITTGNFPRLAEQTMPQVFGKTRRLHFVRRLVPARAVGRFVSRLCAGGVLCGVLIVCPAAVPAQVNQGLPPPALAPRTNAPPDRDAATRKMIERMAKQRNTQRQDKIVADTEKLLTMAQKLNDEVSHSSKNELSIDVVKQAEEIEKLAKSIKQKMRDGY